jgi:hypothetical protein
MRVFKCTRRCFVNGRIYEPGETLRFDADAVAHFECIGINGPKVPPAEPKTVRKTKSPPSRKADILE